MLNKSILPVNGTAITLGEKMLVMDTLASPLTFPEEQSPWGRFPVKLSHSCLLIVESGEVRLNVNFQDSVVAAGCCAIISEGAIVERVEDDHARFVLVLFSRSQLPSMPCVRQNANQVMTCKLRDEHMAMLKQVYHMMRTVLLDDAFAPNREESAAGCLNLMASIVGQGNGSQRAVKARRAGEVVSRVLE